MAFVNATNYVFSSIRIRTQSLCVHQLHQCYAEKVLAMLKGGWGTKSVEVV